MKRTSATLLVLLALAGAFWCGRWSGRPAGGVLAPAAGTHRILYYHDPMHPSYRSDKPGIAPDCGMQLEPVYADSYPINLRTGAVDIGSGQRQLMGVRTAAAERAGIGTVRLLGKVAFDDTQIYRVITATDGLVRKIAPTSPGTIVQKDELLATISSREFLPAQQAYIYALNTMDRFKGLGDMSDEQVKLTGAQIRSSAESLDALGMHEIQIQAVGKMRQAAKEIELRAPVSGLIVARNVFPGFRFERSTELYRIANLNKLWILTDVFERDARFIHPGLRARVLYQGTSYTARVSDSLPQFDSATRTMKARLEMNNPGSVFRPDMFVEIELQVRLPPAVTVPSDAVIDSGLRKTVYVERADGQLEPREVETGWRFADRVAVTKGLQAGERVVVAGTFLVDSESRMRLAAMATEGRRKAAGERDPVCGMDVDPETATRLEYRGTARYFCGTSCKERFQKEPERYLEHEAGGVLHKKAGSAS